MNLLFVDLALIGQGPRASGGSPPAPPITSSDNSFSWAPQTENIGAWQGSGGPVFDDSYASFFSNPVSSSVYDLEFNAMSAGITYISGTYRLSNLTKFTVDFQPLVTYVGDVMPPTLQILILDGDTSLTYVPVVSNTVLQELNIQDSNIITSIPTLPTTMIFLRLGNATGVTSLPSLVGLSTLGTLQAFSSGLTSLPDFEPSLTDIDVSNTPLPASEINTLTGRLVTKSAISGSLDISGTGVPQAPASASIVTLKNNRGWFVTHD